MEIGSSYSSGLQGFQRASEQITEDTANIARQTLAEEATPAEKPVVREEPQPLQSSIVSLTSGLNNAQANVRSIETADEVLGSIIDVKV